MISSYYDFILHVVEPLIKSFIFNQNKVRHVISKRSYFANAATSDRDPLESF